VTGRRLAVAVLAAACAGCGHAPPEEALEPAPADPVEEVEAEDLYDKGIELARSGDLVRAEQYLAASSSRGAPEEQVLPALLRVCIAANRYRIALNYAEPYLREHPRDWSLRFLVASIHLGMGNVSEARRGLEAVIESAPDEPEPRYLLAILLRDEDGDVAGAEAHFQRYLELAPDGRHAEEVRYALTRVRIEMPRRPNEDAAPGSDETEAPAPEQETP
jgi:tetratricopeptide (TPR) repeat protein